MANRQLVPESVLASVLNFVPVQLKFSIKTVSTDYVPAVNVQSNTPKIQQNPNKSFTSPPQVYLRG